MLGHEISLVFPPIPRQFARMNAPKLLAFVACGVLTAGSFASAQESTDPVGFNSFTALDNADLKVGLPLQAQSSYSGVVTAVTGSEVVVENTLPDLTSEPHFLIVTSAGALTGSWYEITSASGSTLSVAEDLQSEGLQSGDSFKVVKFWTLDSLFPQGGGIPQSANLVAPVARVFVYNSAATGTNLTPSSSYLYHTGAQLPEGWYDVNDLGGGVVGDTVINPETFITIRNQSGAAATITMTGSVPTETFSNKILSRSAGSQDNLVYNPFPVEIELGLASLVSSGAIRPSPDLLNPLDRVFLFAESPASLNATPNASYLYHDGSVLPEGWYDVNNLGGGLQDSEVKISGGAPMIIRRSPGPDALIDWAPDRPYDL